MKEGLLLAIALGLAVVAAQAFTADRNSIAPASAAILAKDTSLHPSSDSEPSHQLSSVVDKGFK